VISLEPVAHFECCFDQSTGLFNGFVAVVLRKGVGLVWGKIGVFWFCSREIDSCRGKEAAGESLGHLA
jgi:hypothetical protein